MAEEGVFGKIASHVLEATEQIANRVDEGISVLWKGELPKAASNVQTDPTGDNFEEEVFIDEDMAGSPLEGIADSVLGDIMGAQAGPQTPMEHLQAFRAAIRWTEPFIMSLMIFHVTMFVICMSVSRPNTSLAARVSVMVFLGILVRMAERLNSYAAEHWEDFCTQNYFDQKGVFTGIFLCGPLLLDAFLMLALFLREAAQLLVQVKTMELKKKKGQKGKEKERVSKKRD